MSCYNAEDNTKLRKLQLAELENMRVFSNICDKYNLRYCLLGGTMLGAIRHKGFIPWDDDMDVGLPRPEYERFITIAEKELPEKFALLDYKQNHKYERCVCRLINRDVKLINTSYTETLEENAWIDIFPLDGMPNGKIRRKLHFWSLLFSRFLYHASCFDRLVNLNRSDRAWYLQLIIRFLSITHFGSGIDPKEQLRKIEKKLIKYNYDESTHVVNMFGVHLERELIPKRWLGRFPRYQFEDLFLSGVEFYDQYLTRLYGDYMTPPKDTKKIKHTIADVILQKH